jgi:hypothetical protein
VLSPAAGVVDCVGKTVGPGGALSGTRTVFEMVTKIGSRSIGRGLSIGTV